MSIRFRLINGAVLAGLTVACAPGAWAETPRSPLPDVIRRIMTADYEGDRAALDRLYHEVDAYLSDTTVESRVRYWKAYAKWRRAINGANETITPTDLAGDSVLCADEMQRASAVDPAFVDAKIGEMQCLGLVLFFDRDHAGNDQRVTRLRALLKELKETAADNPRYVWAWGMAFFGVPAEKGGGPDNVIKAYFGALDAMKKGAGKPKTPLDPGWGEPELFVNLAYSYFNKPDPDLKLAKKYVDKAIRRAPNWHYAKDILRPQIEKAMKDRE